MLSFATITLQRKRRDDTWLAYIFDGRFPIFPICVFNIDGRC
jgi:hypothetical protein